MRKIEDVTLKDGRNLKEVLELHKKWIEDSYYGKKADLSYEDLSDVDFSNSDLRYAILSGANLSYANLECAYLEGANLKYANLKNVYLNYAYLENANLKYANLIHANLKYSYLKGADLKYANLTNTNLTHANLISADLTGVNLRGANLTDTNLEGADLKDAYLTGVNLKGMDLKGADLRGANLTRAILVDANLTDVKYDNTTAFFELQCPEEGSFIGYKKANDKIIKLLITEDAKRSSATTRKCRCSKAKVLSITSLDGKEEYTKVTSDHDSNFVYEVGKIVEDKDFDENRWNECSTGIHFFVTRDEAVMY